MPPAVLCPVSGRPAGLAAPASIPALLELPERAPEAQSECTVSASAACGLWRCCGCSGEMQARSELQMGCARDRRAVADCRRRPLNRSLMSTRAERRALQEQQRAAKALAAMAPEHTCEIVLVRHGETAWNAEERLQGQLMPGPCLTERGQRQAQALGERLAREPLAALYSSDLLRARETADIVAAARRAAASGSSAAGSGGSSSPGSSGAGDCTAAADVCIDAGLRERYLGCLQGLTRREAAEQHPEAFASLAAPGPAGGEVRCARCRACLLACTSLVCISPACNPPSLSPTYSHRRASPKRLTSWRRGRRRCWGRWRRGTGASASWWCLMAAFCPWPTG